MGRQSPTEPALDLLHSHVCFRNRIRVMHATVSVGDESDQSRLAVTRVAAMAPLREVRQGQLRSHSDVTDSRRCQVTGALYASGPTSKVHVSRGLRR